MKPLAQSAISSRANRSNGTEKYPKPVWPGGMSDGVRTGDGGRDDDGVAISNAKLVKAREDLWTKQREGE